MASLPPESDPPERSAGSSGLDDTMPAAMPLMEPPGPEVARLAERYRMGVELGRGGMGRVVEAFDVQLGRTVALKEALPRGGHGTYRRFAREIHITARLDHASIVPLYDSGTTADGRPFYVMRRVTGKPFDELIARARGLGERLTLLPRLLAAIDAIGHAHERGVIHRDLKPANILIGNNGETVVIDWGLAKMIGEAEPSPDSRDSMDPMPSDSLRTQVGSVFGTPGFMAPEQARGEELGTGGDVYALGATLYQMLTGMPPYGGKSATEVIDRNRKAEIRPIAEAAPEAPRELIAIVAKALAPHAAERYPHAGALAADVRRFLDGQLVAAHRYTRTQRVRRFMRRNRAPLGVAALAAVAVAILAWFSVHRILQERALAVAGQRVAEERAEALLVERARALVDTNPTQALATLKGLPVGSAHEPEARAIAQAASARGVAWGIDDEGGGPSLMFPTLSPTGARLAVVSGDGHLRVYDTDTRALLLERAYERGTHVVWVADGTRLLLYHSRSPALLIDPATGGTAPLPIGIIGDAAASDHGDRVVYAHGEHEASLLELATGKVTPLWTGPDAVDSVAIAPDGSWIVVGGSKQVVVYDGTGREIARRDLGHVIWASGSNNRKLVLMSAAELWELEIDRVAWTPISPELPTNSIVMHAIYRGDVLTVLTSLGDVREWHGTTWVTRLQVGQMSSLLVPVGSDLLLLAAGDGHIYWISQTMTGALTLPSIVNTQRLSAGRESARLAVSGDNLIMVYDLTTLSPARLDAPRLSTFAFLDDDTVLFWTNGDVWTLYRTQTGQRVTFAIPWLGSAQLVDELPEEGRVLLQYLEVHAHLLEVRDDAKPLRQLATATTSVTEVILPFLGRLIPGDATVFSSNNVVQGTIADARPHELARLDGDVVSLARVGYLEYAAISAHGELVRGSLATGAIERTRVPASQAYAIEGYAGKVVIGTGSQLLMWDTEVSEIAHFTQPVRALYQIEGGVAVMLADGRVLDVAPDPATHAFTSTEILPRGSDELHIANGGTLMIARGNAGVLNVVELPSRARWSMPMANMAHGTIAIAPTSRQILQQFGDLVTWKLPHIDGDLHAWLEHQTNAIEDADGDLSWPWQTP